MEPVPLDTIIKINKSTKDNGRKTPMESAEIKATRSPVEKAGTLCPDSTRCTSQYLHCTEETAQVSHQWSLVDNVCNTNSFMEYQNMVKTARPEPLT